MFLLISKNFFHIRSIWKKAGQEFPDFPSKANSHHLRKSATTYAHTYGSNKVRSQIHVALNHSASTNSRSYQTSIREHQVTSTKMAIKKLQQKCKRVEVLSTTPANRTKDWNLLSSGNSRSGKLCHMVTFHSFVPKLLTFFFRTHIFIMVSTS